MVVDNLFGKGVYTPKMALQLTGAKVHRTNRLLFGDDRYEPVWTPEIKVEGEKVFSFKDLMEIRAIQFFAKSVSLQKIRKAREIFVEELNTDFPFSSGLISTDGKSLLFKEACEDVFSGQQNAEVLIKDSLLDVEFGDGNTPSQWWVEGRSKGIVLNPKRHFGRPIDDETGIATNAIYLRYLVNENDQDTADYFDIPLSAVTNACAFEKYLLRTHETVH